MSRNKGPGAALGPQGAGGALSCVGECEPRPSWGLSPGASLGLVSSAGKWAQRCLPDSSCPLIY